MEIKNAEIAFKDSEAKSQKMLLAQGEKLKWYLYLIIGLVVVFAVFMYSRFRISQKQKEVIDGQRKEVEQKKQQIENQHHQLEETHQEISDSIKYAQRLQQAILPPSISLSQNLGEGFVLFRPKDVVSGDFYWMQRVDNKVFFAVADCTGHGVPGAMVSVVCSNALNRAVKEFNCFQTNTILDKTRDLVIETFARSGKDVKDGMDISICSLNIKPNTNTVDITQGLEYSGANNPIWIVREKNNLSMELENKSELFDENPSVLIEIKGDRQPVGAYSRNFPFGVKNEKLFKGDVLYLFSDGYADQFGGEKGKKMKYKPFKKMLVSMYQLDMESQERQLHENFDNWKKDFEQVDDVCIIGVKI
jgi:serine phosphatase RsbU (regulator of sigma subunit)